MFEWLDKYRDKFGEPLPMFYFRGKTDEEIIEIVKSCLEKGKLFVPDIESDGNY
ncbi:MAG: hypothetical protein RR268_06930 [Kiritimatiellia bacterium]